MKASILIAATLCACLPGGLALAEPPSGTSALASRADDPDLAWGPCPAFLPEGCQIAVLQGDPSAANADVFFRVPGGARIARHWHTSPERMVLVAGELKVTYDGHPAATLRGGSYAYGPARLPHSAHCASESPCVLMIAFEQPVDAFEGGHDQHD